MARYGTDFGRGMTGRGYDRGYRGGSRGGGMRGRMMREGMQQLGRAARRFF